jgi:phosphoenolpyruvate---glycerone phosphotransferase subunit DhaM
MAATVGIVLVSHSASLAEGTAELAGQVGGGAVTIATAGGTDDGRLGTSIDKVSSAIELDDLPGPLEVADAPFVEGAVAAAVTAAAGGSLKAVLDAAQEARHARKL